MIPYQSKKCDYSIFLFLSFLVIISCKNPTDVNENEKTNKNRPYTHTLKSIGQIQFPLDSETEFDNRSIYAFHQNGKPYISILSTSPPKIDVYDYTRKNKEKIIPIAEEGPNNVGKITENLAHFMDDLDTLFIQNEWTKLIYLLNDKGEVLRRINYTKTNRPLLSNAYGFASNPIKKRGNKLILPLRPINEETVNFDYTKIPTMLILNYHTGQIEYPVFLPNTYNEGFYGTNPFKYRSNFVQHPETNHYLINFAIDAHIYEYDHNYTFIKKYLIPSEHFSTIPPFSQSVPSPNEYSEEKNREYTMTNPDFNWMIYDEPSQIFVRMAYLRPSLEKYKSGHRLPHATLIIFNLNMEKIGETFLNGGVYRPDIFFHNEEGIHIARSDWYGRDENFLPFEIFRPMEIVEEK
jgi:hypothetical protein